MTRKTIVDNGNGTYMVSSTLVHWAITSIITGMVLLGVSLITGTFADREWKATTDANVDAIQKRLLSRAADVDAITALRVRVQENTQIIIEVRDRLARNEERVRYLESAPRGRQ
jgi:hypothetical protein